MVFRLNIITGNATHSDSTAFDHPIIAALSLNQILKPHFFPPFRFLPLLPLLSLSPPQCQQSQSRLDTAALMRKGQGINVHYPIFFSWAVAMMVGQQNIDLYLT